MMITQMIYTEMESPIGPLTIVAIAKSGAEANHTAQTEFHLCNLEFGASNDVLPIITDWVQKHSLHGELLKNDEILRPVVTALEEYFNGIHCGKFDLPIELYGTPFQKKVWNELLKIEYGTTKSYKEIAEALLAPKAVRAVGTAIGRNPLPIIIPCHRVINTSGKLGGFTGGLEKKVKLLQIENIQ